MKTIQNQKGFTLVELPIVLAAVGIMLGATLEAREMINTARISHVYSQYQEIAAAILSYQDRYGMFPGDDNKAAARGGAWAGSVNGNGDGAINGTATNTINCAAGGVEGCQLWDHLRRAGFIPGAPGTVTNPINTFGGQIAVGNYAVHGLTTNWIEFTNIPADTAAQIIDIQHDDGGPTTGNIRASAAYNAGTTVTLYFRLN